MSDLPAPLVSSDIDIRGFSGFMLDVDRLLASELVALGSPEECWHALMLWCRAWQQHPHASLPNDDRVLAAFSRAGQRWKKVKSMALHGFVLCADGRLYHPVLADLVIAAWNKRRTYLNDQERLKLWRQNKRRNEQGNSHSGENETPQEMRVKRVSNPVSQAVSTGVSKPDREGERESKSSEGSLRSPSASIGLFADVWRPPDPDQRAPLDARTELFRDGLATLRRLTGKPENPSRAFLGVLLKDAGDDCALVMQAIRKAEELRPAEPTAWLKKVVTMRTRPPPGQSNITGGF